MRVVLHIGQAKAGSSALQAAFAQAGRLAAHRVMYPAAGGRAVPNHRPLAYGVDWVQYRFGALEEESFQAQCRAIETEIAAHEPCVVVLSSEALFQPVRPGGPARLASWLHGLTPDVTVAAYLRRPAEKYLATVQQQLRGGRGVAQPGPVVYRAILEAYEAAFPGKVELAPFERAAMPERNIARDFIHRFVPELLPDEAHFPAIETNVGSSAEIMAAMHDLAPLALEGVPGDVRPLLMRVERLLREAAASDGIDMPRAALQPEIAAYVDRCSIDVRWLRARYGFVFKDYDYDAPEPASAPPIVSRVSDICVVDDIRLARLGAAFARRRAAEPAR